MATQFRTETAMMALVAAASLALLHGEALAQTVYRCTDPSGAIRSL